MHFLCKKFFSKLQSGHFFSSSFNLMRNIQGSEVPPALPILTIVIESWLSWVFFSCFFTSAEPTTWRTPVLPRTPISPKLIWKNGCSFFIFFTRLINCSMILPNTLNFIVPLELLLHLDAWAFGHCCLRPLNSTMIFRLRIFFSFWLNSQNGCHTALLLPRSIA